MIKELEQQDLEALLGLYEHLHSTDDPLPARSEIQALWSTIQANGDLHYFGTYIQESLIATCTLAIIPNLTRGCRPYGVIENVVTHTRFRRQGHGQAILRHALTFAWQRRCYKVMLFTGSKREEVYQFYEAAGFDRYAKQAFLARPPSA